MPTCFIATIVRATLAAVALTCALFPTPAGAQTSTIPPFAQQLLHDDGTAESRTAVLNQARTANIQAVYLNRFEPSPEQFPITVTNLAILFPLLGDVPPGLAFEALIYVDPSGSDDPRLATLARRIPIAAEPSDTKFQIVDVVPGVEVGSGAIYVGFTDVSSATEQHLIRPVALDLNSSPDASYIAANVGGFDGEVLADAENVFRAPSSGAFMIRAFYTTGGKVQLCWDPGDDDLAPPSNVRICDDSESPGVSSPRRDRVGFNVYRSNSPNVQTTTENLFATTGPETTTTAAGVAPGGSFFVVTSIGDGGESGPSNEVAALPPTVSSFKVKAAKIVVKGSGFTDRVQVFVDGIPFVDAARVKSGKKVVQKGSLLTGQSIGAYLAAHNGRARIAVRNADGTLTNVNAGQ
jgi:hypothetical protein